MHMQIHLFQYVCAGALGSLCRDFIARLFFKFSDFFLQIEISVMTKQTTTLIGLSSPGFYATEITPGSATGLLGDLVHAFSFLCLFFSFPVCKMLLV